jgi:transcriptional regulator with AAA-type ATPase domain
MGEEKNIRRIQSESLGPDAVEHLRGRGREISFTDSETIVRRGDPGTSFYVILSGMVEVRLTADRDRQLPLVRLQEGAFFGEMSILTSTSVSADVVALGPVKVLCCSAEDFSSALSECAPLRSQIMAGMAANLQRTSQDAWNFFQRAEALNVLVDSVDHAGPVIAHSRSMQSVVDSIASCAGRTIPVFIRGEPGTGKAFVASRIHHTAAGAKAPFIVVDCRALSGEEAVPFLFGTSRFMKEGSAPAGYRALHGYGALHLANNGTLVLRHIGALVPEGQEVLCRYLDTLASGAVPYPRTRIIATGCDDLEEQAGGERIRPELADILGRQTISLPPLRKRRKDIVPLARFFLDRHRQEKDRAFSLQAEHTLISREYSHRNADELREAVEMGALFADGRVIEEEHIFTGPKDRGDSLEFDLGRIPLVERLTSRRVLEWVRSAVFLAFAVIILLSLAFGRTPAGASANAVTWSIWEPLLLVFFLFVGRVWCTVCPLSTAGRIATRFACMEKPPGDWMKTYANWFIIAGFIAIVWSEHTFNMTANPAAAGILLLSLMAAAVVFSIIYKRESWCRYLCPLGNLGAVYSMPAVLNVRANPDVCATYCTTHECFKGSDRLPGCPVFHHPLYARDSHHCKQCCTCLWICPHDSARLYARLPLQSIWRQADLGGDLVPFSFSSSSPPSCSPPREEAGPPQREASPRPPCWPWPVRSQCGPFFQGSSPPGQAATRPSPPASLSLC